MTDRYNALTVVLNHDIRDDDAKQLIEAIKMLRDVLDVRGEVTDGVSEAVAATRVRREIVEKVLDALRERR